STNRAQCRSPRLANLRPWRMLSCCHTTDTYYLVHGGPYEPRVSPHSVCRHARTWASIDGILALPRLGFLVLLLHLLLTRLLRLSLVRCHLQLPPDRRLHALRLAANVVWAECARHAASPILHPAPTRVQQL